MFFGAEPVEDPGPGELADTTQALAGEYRTSTRGRAVHRAGDLLDAAAGELRSADRFRGTLLPQVNRHLRHAHTLLLQARRHLEAAADGNHARTTAHR